MNKDKIISTLKLIFEKRWFKYLALGIITLIIGLLWSYKSMENYFAFILLFLVNIYFCKRLLKIQWFYNILFSLITAILIPIFTFGISLIIYYTIFYDYSFTSREIKPIGLFLLRISTFLFNDSNSDNNVREFGRLLNILLHPIISVALLEIAYRISERIKKRKKQEEIINKPQ